MAHSLDSEALALGEEPTGTKLALVHAAGELFAENGFDGTSVRAIAERARVNIAAINYHFGGKENLYTEVLRYVVVERKGLMPSAILADEERLKTPAGIAEALRAIVKEKFTAWFSPEQPAWFGRLVMRSLIDPTTSLQVVAREIFEPNHEAIQAIFQKACPDMPEFKARLWTFSLVGQILFYELARAPIMMLLEMDGYDEDFIKAATEHVAQETIKGVGLPLFALAPESELEPRQALAGGS